MVSRSSHTNHEFLILLIRVSKVSFAIESFVTYEKGLIILHMKSIIASYEVLQKIDRENVTKILKNICKG